MHKSKLYILGILLLLLTGCTKLTNNLDEVIKTVLTDNSSYVNTVSTGYELYIPAGVKQVIDNEYNQKFRIKDRYLYLYVDTVSYYYKNILNFQRSDNYNYYYKQIDNNNKTGYIGINKVQDDLYYGVIVYNYAKMEFYSDEDNLPLIVANSLIIIDSIKYNDVLIELEFGSGVDVGREIKYELDHPDDAISSFSDYLQEYVPEEDTSVELPDED